MIFVIEHTLFVIGNSRTLHGIEPMTSFCRYYKHSRTPSATSPQHPYSACGPVAAEASN